MTSCLAKQNKRWAKLRVRASSLRSFMRVQTKNKSFLEHMAFWEKKIDLSLPYDDKSSGPICFPLWDMAWLWGSLEKKAFIRRISIYHTIYWDQCSGIKMFMKQINPKFVYPILLHHNRSHANCREWPIVSSQSFIKNVLSWKKSAIGRLPKQIPIFLNCKRCLSKIEPFFFLSILGRNLCIRYSS